MAKRNVKLAKIRRRDDSAAHFIKMESNEYVFNNDNFIASSSMLLWQLWRELELNIKF